MIEVEYTLWVVVARIKNRVNCTKKNYAIIDCMRNRHFTAVLAQLLNSNGARTKQRAPRHQTQKPRATIVTCTRTQRQEHVLLPEITKTSNQLLIRYSNILRILRTRTHQRPKRKDQRSTLNTVRRNGNTLRWSYPNRRSRTM